MKDPNPPCESTLVRCVSAGLSGLYVISYFPPTHTHPLFTQSLITHHSSLPHLLVHSASHTTTHHTTPTPAHNFKNNWSAHNKPRGCSKFASRSCRPSSANSGAPRGSCLPAPVLARRWRRELGGCSQGGEEGGDD